MSSGGGDREFWTGVLVLGALAAAIAAYALSGGGLFRPTRAHYVVKTHDLAGAAVGTPVEMSGYALGSVGSVTVLPSPALHFELGLEVDPAIAIAAGTEAVISARSLAGGAVVVLLPPREPGGDLEQGGVIAGHAERELTTEATAALAEVTATVRDLRAALLGGPGAPGTVARVDAALDEVAAAVEGLRDTVSRVEASAGPSLERDLVALETTLETTDRVALDVERHVGEGGSVDQLAATMTATMRNLDEAAAVVRKYDPVENPDIAATLQGMKEATERMNRILAHFEERPMRTLLGGSPDPEASRP